MAKANSFDIASQTDLNEVQNAVHQTMKEVQQRFDFKGSRAEVSLEDSDLIVLAEDQYKLESLQDILGKRLVKRGVSLKALSYGKIEAASGGAVRRRIAVQQGIPTEKAREIAKFVRDTRLKVQAAIQGDTVRVSGRDRDTLQEVISKLREKDFGIHMQFTNYRSN